MQKICLLDFEAVYIGKYLQKSGTNLLSPSVGILHPNRLRLYTSSHGNITPLWESQRSLAYFRILLYVNWWHSVEVHKNSQKLSVFGLNIQKAVAYLRVLHNSCWGRATNQKVADSFPDVVIGIFHWHASFWSHYGPGAYSGSNRNEYREYFLGVNAAGA
jgi:hypothetical protein